MPFMIDTSFTLANKLSDARGSFLFINELNDNFLLCDIILRHFRVHCNFTKVDVEHTSWNISNAFQIFTHMRFSFHTTNSPTMSLFKFSCHKYRSLPKAYNRPIPWESWKITFFVVALLMAYGSFPASYFYIIKVDVFIDLQ